MESILTLAGFALVTAFAIALHLRRAGRSSGCRLTVERICPRCAGEVPAKVKHCPSCGVAMQIYEIAGARSIECDSESKEAATKLHAVVRADVCVGCGACVPACPEPGAILLRGKLAVVDLAKCKGHGECVKACPVGGILLASGEAFHRVEVPDVRIDFQTNVPGVYIAGELGGRGLIKNAINEGKMAAESVAKSLREFPSSSSPEVLDVAIIGSGPAGLSAALEAKRLGLRAAVFEQGTLADSIRKYPRHKLLLAEPVRIPLFGDLWIEDASKETLIATWETAIRHSGLEVRTGCRVQDVVRDVDGFKISGEGVSASARRVILATGRRGTPRRLGVPGEELDKVFYDIVEMEAFRGRRVLVVGGGDSAVESAVGLAAQQGTTTTLSYRGSELARVKERNLEKLEREVQQGRVGLLLNSRVREITPDEVLLNVAEDKTLRLPNDNVIVRIGGEPPALFLERVGVRTVRKEITLEASRDAVHA